MSEQISILQNEAIELLKSLIATPSYSREEEGTAQILEQYFAEKRITTNRHLNNIWVTNKYYDKNKPTLLLNSHHDTVKPNIQYTNDPFNPFIEDGKLFGLGSNDAGGCLVSLIAAFLYFYEKENLNYNLIFAASAEEEISGINGIEELLKQIPSIDCAIVGEPTQMQMAIAERGLLVVDCNAQGKAGHAARNEGENALYKAIEDINWLRNFSFQKNSPLLGENKMTVTIIETENKAHNVVPASCKFVIDCRINELYTFEEVMDILKTNLKSEIKARSFRLRSTAIALEHPLVKAGMQLERSYYGSPTTSDKALMNFPALKMGPGDSARSHTANEYIYINEIKEGIELYIKLMEQVLQTKK